MSKDSKMRRVAVFGNAGGGKSTLARRLAEITHLPLHSLDTIKYKPGGGEVPRDEYHRYTLSCYAMTDGSLTGLAACHQPGNVFLPPIH